MTTEQRIERRILWGTFYALLYNARFQRDGKLGSISDATDAVTDEVQRLLNERRGAEPDDEPVRAYYQHAELAAGQTHTAGCHGDPHDGQCMDQPEVPRD